MGTPLKSLQALLSPRVVSPLSPLSPRLLSVPKNYENVVKSKNLLPKRERLTNAAKKLEFSHHLSPNRYEEAVQIKITNYTSVAKDVEINTPNKKNISEHGIGTNQSHTVLGIGSFGKVIRGIYKGDTVAVKVVKNTFTLGEKNALNLSHHNIVKTLDIIQNPDGNYSLMIMEYFPDSKQLQTILEDNDFKKDINTISFALDICNGLDFIHEKRILHLDIKPQNILVAKGACKICDFGNSVLATETENFQHQGTAVYTAPELLQGKAPTEKCDVYSLGILLWQMRSSQPPYLEIDNVETVIYKVVKCNFRPENTTPIDEYSRLYQSCWDKNPNNRPDVCSILPKLHQML